MGHTILTAYILAHSSFNKSLNHLLKNGSPTFTADDYAHSYKIFNIAALSRDVKLSQEELNSMMKEDMYSLLYLKPPNLKKITDKLTLPKPKLP